MEARPLKALPADGAKKNERPLPRTLVDILFSDYGWTKRKNSACAPAV
jgi:hypothetical protein